MGVQQSVKKWRFAICWRDTYQSLEMELKMANQGSEIMTIMTP